MSIELNKIYKVKEGHEGKCEKYIRCNGKYILINAIGNSLHYYILDLKTERLMMCNCFTEDDLEEEELTPPKDTVKEIEKLKIYHNNSQLLYSNLLDVINKINELIETVNTLKANNDSTSH